MSTLEEFEAAPVGATARSHYGTGVKTTLSHSPWVCEVRYPGGVRRTERHTSEHLVEQGYVLDPSPVPTSAREALDLAWELAHPIKAGDVIPAGTRCIQRHKGTTHWHIYDEIGDFETDVYAFETIRTLDPLPEPAPDWLDAPAVLAMDRWDDLGREKAWIQVDGDLYKGEDGEFRAWSDLRDVAPLYPKEKK